MIRYNLFLTQKQLEALKEISEGGRDVSKQIRIAIDRYIQSKLKQRFKVATSPSKLLKNNKHE